MVPILTHLFNEKQWKLLLNLKKLSFSASKQMAAISIVMINGFWFDHQDHADFGWLTKS